MVVSDSAFLSNEGGGLVVFNGNLALTDSNFTENTGTAVYFETSQEDTPYNLEVGKFSRLVCLVSSLGAGCPRALLGCRGQKFGRLW